jgi:parallel beta-helix repeat protein
MDEPMKICPAAMGLLLVLAATACSDGTFPNAPTEENGVSALAPDFSLVGGGGSPGTLKSRLYPDMCLDVPESAYISGRLLIVWTCNSGPNQQFIWKSTGEIVPAGSQSLCVDAFVGQAVVGLWNCHGGPNQRWSATSAGEIKGTDGRCVGLASTVKANGTKLQVQTCNGSNSQKWDNGGTQALPPPPSPTLPSGIAISPGQSIQSFVNANPGGSTFILKAGTYTRQTVTPKSGDRFFGEPGAVLDGQGATAVAFTKGNAPFPSNVTISGLKITGYVPPMQGGAIDAGGPDANYGTSGWLIDRNEISYNAEYGIRIGNSSQITNNNVHHNKRLNIGGVANNTTIASNEIAFGNYLNLYNTNFEAGGTKFVLANGLILRNNYVHDNVGVGLHLDESNINTVIDGNRVDRNGSEGIAIEISYKTTISNNTVTNNGWHDPRNRYTWAWNAGILVAASPNVEVYGNTLSGNYTGIMAVQQNRGSGPYGEHIVQNLYVHDNNVTQTSGSWAGGGAQDVGSTAIFTSRNNRWVHNTYRVTSGASPFTWMNVGWVNWTQWKAYGQDVTGALQ